MGSPFKIVKDTIKPWFLIRERRGLVYALFVALLCFSMGMLFQRFYYEDSMKPLDVEGFQKKVYEKEAFSSKWMKYIRDRIAADQLFEVSRNQALYQESELNEVAFHVYRGDSLLYWSSDAFGVQNNINFDLGRSAFLRVDNAYLVAMQSYYREYRIIALIKIKELYDQNQDSKWNLFAKSFGVPGNVAISEVQLDAFTPVFSSSGNYLFSIQQKPLREGSLVLFTLSVIFWLAGITFLFVFADRMLRWSELYDKRKRFYVWLGIFLFFPALLVSFLIFRFPSILFARLWNPLSYSSPFAPTAEHLIVYALFFTGFLTLLRRNLSLSLRVYAMSWIRSFFTILFMKFFIFVAFGALYLYLISLVYDSNVNLAVSSIQEVNHMSVCAVLLMMLWAYMLYACASKFKLMYVSRENVSAIVVSHLLLTVISGVLFAYYGSVVDVFLMTLFSLVFLFEELDLVYLRMNMFVRTIISSFVLINMIVIFTYWHSERKCMMAYADKAKEIATNNSVREDKVAEIVLADYEKKMAEDTTLNRLLKSQSAKRDSLALTHLSNSYLRIFKDFYNIRIQISERENPAFHVWRTGLGSVRYDSLAVIQSSFRRLNKDSHFYACEDEAFSVSFLGSFPFDDKLLYVKLYPKLTREIHGRSTTQRRKNEIGNECSLAKYCGGALCYSDGVFRYPASANWLPVPFVADDEEPSFVMEGNDYTHYVYYLKENDVYAITSVPERQSYIYVIFVTFMFSIYLFIAVCYFLYNNMKKARTDGRRSFVATLQTIFILPMVLSFFILAAVTFPFFSDQFEKTHHTDMKDKSYVAQHSLQDILGFATSLEKHQKVLDEFVRNVSDYYQMDVSLYDEAGRLFASSRPVLDSREFMKLNLMNPLMKFCEYQDLYVLEKVGRMDCYSNYVSVYNNRNECVGYLKLTSIWGYYHVKTQLFNIMVVIVDIYLFVMVFSIVVIWLLNKRTAKPLSLLAQRFAEVSLTGENSAIDYHSKDELGDLVRQYNKMVVQLEESAKKLVQSERDFAWRDMARRIAHEVKNPLTPMKLCVQQCQRKKENNAPDFEAYFNKTCNVLIEQIDTLAEIATSFSSFAKATQSKLERVDILKNLRQSVSLFENNEDGVLFTLDDNGYESAYVMIDDKHSMQMFSNLFSNAIQAIPEETFGEVNVTFEKQNGFVVISIQDNGSGISEEVQEKMFIPNFTTKTSGMGLGMAIVKSVLDAAGAEITFDTELNVGTTFYIKIPLCEERVN